MKKVLIIEDDPAIQDVLGLLFTHAGYRTTAYTNGQVVLTGEFDIPDLFVIDKQLSGVDGLEICKHLKSRPLTWHLPVIILSATPQLQAQIKQAGADAFLEKPFSNNDLLQVAATLVGGS
jgi:CheY-like chemotaxis protein